MTEPSRIRWRGCSRIYAEIKLSQPAIHRNQHKIFGVGVERGTVVRVGALRDLRLGHGFTFRRLRIADPGILHEPLVLHTAVRTVGFAEKYRDGAEFPVFDVSASEDRASCLRTTDHKHVHTASSCFIARGPSTRVRGKDKGSVTIQRRC